jgi:hypothetical protein
VLQIRCDLRPVVTAAAGSQQHCSERQRSGTSERVHRLNLPVVHAQSQAGERDGSVNLAVGGR